MSLYQVLPDDKIPGFSRGDPEIAKPQIHRLYPRDVSIQLDERKQRFWFNLNNKRGFAEELTAWQSYVDTAFTSGVRLRAGHDYISDVRSWSPLPRAFPCVFGLNVLRGYETIAYGIRGLADGTPILKIDTIDLNEYPDFSMTRDTHPHLIGIANIVTPKKLTDGTYQINAFTQRGGREGLPVYHPIWSYSEAFLPMSMLRKLETDSPIPPAYNPA